MPEKLSPDELERISAKVTAEVLQRVSQTLAGEVGSGLGARAAAQFVFKCPGDFECTKVFKCSQNFTALTEAL
jgi:hypothetical protein